MVVFEDFEFSLVCAETKTPFQEHYSSKDGRKTYVEAEPDAEYFMAVRKARAASKKDLHCKFFVDGTDLGYVARRIGANLVEKNPAYMGIRSKSDGVSTHRALKFVKAKANGSGGAGGGGGGGQQLAMGQVRMDVYESVFKGMVQDDDGGDGGGGGKKDHASSFAAASVSDGNDMAKKKNLRSGEGTTTIVSSKVKPKKEAVSASLAAAGGPGTILKKKYKRGPLLYSISLNYCAAVGLIAVGVLEKPPSAWDAHRMLHPAKKSDNDNDNNDSDKKPKAKGVAVKRTSDGKHELLEIRDDDDADDDDDSSDDEVENVPHQSKKKPKTEAT